MSLKTIVTGDPVNDAERRAFDLLRAKLQAAPDSYALCTNISLPNPRNRLNEIDAIVIGPTMIFVIEVKGWRGQVTLQRETWYLDDGSPRPNPIELLSRKAKELKSELERFDRNGLARRSLWVQELVYVNGPNAKLVDADYGRRTNYNIAPFAFENEAALMSAILKPDRWANVPPFSPIERATIEEYLRGGKERPRQNRIANFVVVEQLPSTTERVERLLVRDDLATTDDTVELHVYALDGGKQQRADTIALVKRQLSTIQSLAATGVVPKAFTAVEAQWNGTEVIAIPFESFAKAQPFADVLADGASRGLKETLRYGLSLAEAIGELHAQGVVHGALEPSAIVLRHRGDPASIVIRNLELARPAQMHGMSLLPASTVSALASVYASPKVLQGGRPSFADDVYSFGALFAHLVFGKPIFANAAAALAGGKIPSTPGGAPDAVDELRILIGALLARTETQRPASMADVALRLDLLARRVGGAGEREKLGEYEVLRELRAGATGRTVVAQRRDQAGEMVLKIARRGTAAADALLREVELLLELRHENIVVARTSKDVGENKVGEFDLISGEDLARRRGRLDAFQLRAAIGGLFAALGAVHARGRVHRDVKPANVMLTSENKAVLLDFGLAAASGDQRVEVGTAPYKSSRLFERGAWTGEDDIYAAALTLWEAMGGTHPWNGAEPEGDPRLDAAELATVLGTKDAERFAQAIRRILLGTGLDAATAARRLLTVVGKSAQQALSFELDVTVELDAAATLDDSIGATTLSEHLRAALAERGIVTLDDARRLRTEDFLRIRTIGRAAVDELSAFVAALRERFGEPPTEPTAVTILPAPLLGFAPALVGDERPIAQLGLDARIVHALEGLGRRTIGELAMLRPTTVLDIPGLGPDAEVRIRTAFDGFERDPEGWLVDRVMPEWRLERIEEIRKRLATLGTARDDVLRVLQVAGADITGAIAWAPPWTADDFLAFSVAVTSAISWPPSPSGSALTAALASSLPERLLALGEEALGRAAETVLGASDQIAQTKDASWFRLSAVRSVAALQYAIERVQLPLPPANLLQQTRDLVPGIVLPSSGTAEALAAFKEAGLAFDEAGRLDRIDARTEPREPDPSEIVDVERNPVDRTVATIVATRLTVAFRLVVTEPGPHVWLARKLLRGLQQQLGPERVHAIDVDRALCQALEERGLLAGALKRDARGFAAGNLETFAGAAARDILRGALVSGRRDDVTLLYNLGGLTHTQAAGTLRSVYQDARGGTDFGAIVVCVPGDRPREYARLNRSIPLVVTGSDPLLYLEASA